MACADACRTRSYIGINAVFLSCIFRHNVFEYLVRVGMDSNPSSAAEMQQKIAAELDLWGKVVKVPGFQWQ